MPVHETNPKVGVVGEEFFELAKEGFLSDFCAIELLLELLGSSRSEREFVVSASIDGVGIELDFVVTVNVGE